MRKMILAVVLAVVMAVGLLGCGTIEETTIYNQSERPSIPSIELLSPNGGEVVVEGSMLIVRWDIADESFGYNESYDLYWFLIPQGSTPVRSGDGTFFDVSVGGYNLGGWSPSVPYAGEGGTYIGMPIDIPEGTYKLKIYLTKHNEDYCLDLSEVLSSDKSDNIFTVKIDPAVFATDSDRSINYSWAGTIYDITPQNYPDLFVSGVGKGMYQGSNINFIFGQDPNPEIAKLTTDNFSTYYDHCATSMQLNEAYVTIDGQLSAIGVQCPNGCQNGACIP